MSSNYTPSEHEEIARRIETSPGFVRWRNRDRLEWDGDALYRPIVIDRADQPTITRDGMLEVPEDSLEPGDVLKITMSDAPDGITWSLKVE